MRDTSAPRPVRRRQPTHPGEVLREDVLPPLRLSVSEAARQLRVTRQTLHRVLSENEIGRLALAEFVGHHRFELQERFQREDVAWALDQKGETG